GARLVFLDQRERPGNRVDRAGDQQVVGALRIAVVALELRAVAFELRADAHRLADEAAEALVEGARRGQRGRQRAGLAAGERDRVLGFRLGEAAGDGAAREVDRE